MPDLGAIRERLLLIFPPALDGRSWAVAERAARSLYVFLYVLGVEGVTGNRVRPAMVTTMSDAQAARRSMQDRMDWWQHARSPRRPDQPIPGRWYAENTREPIRDETFRVWKEYGALLEASLPTTSSIPRYSLARDFADLFDPALPAEALNAAVAAWQEKHLTPAARARMALVRQQATAAAGALVTFPDGMVRSLTSGPSTPLLKAAVEEFAGRFLRRPVVLVVTESRRRLAYEDANQLRLIGLAPDPRVMPDLLLADLESTPDEIAFVFIECVATGGAMTRDRVAALREWLANNGFADARSAFGTVFADRADPAFRRYVGELAWGSFVWFMSEPEGLLVFLEGGMLEPQTALATVIRS